MKVEEISDSAVDENKKMNKIDEMWPICHDCPYWEVCDPTFICEITEEKMKDKNSECGKTVFECNMCPFREGCKQRKEV